MNDLRLHSLSLSVGNLDRARAFYTRVLSMSCAQEGARVSVLSYPASNCMQLQLIEEAGYSTEVSASSYWKIGICVDDVDSFRAAIIAAGHTVTEASIFEDVGYLCHLRDPDGYLIEILQRRFTSNESVAKNPVVNSRPPCIGQLSFKVDNIEQQLRFYQQLGMRLISTQQLKRHGFSLYFLTSEKERAPAIEDDVRRHCEWLWQRNYTLLELQGFEAEHHFKRHNGVQRIEYSAAYEVQWPACDPNNYPLQFTVASNL